MVLLDVDVLARVQRSQLDVDMVAGAELLDLQLAIDGWQMFNVVINQQSLKIPRRNVVFI